MYITRITNEYNNISSTDYDNMTLTNCTNNENKIEIVIPLITIVPCGISFNCLIYLTAYTLIKPLLSKN